jgi:ribose 5-phosphate isomerase B
MLYIGADHRGFKLKESLKEFLARKRLRFLDLGNTHYHKTDDYTDIGYIVAKKVGEKPNTNQGILICGSGIGICIVANKVKGVRAGLAVLPKLAKKGKEDDDMNVLCLASDLHNLAEAKKIISVWLKAKFKKEKRYVRRVKEIEKIEMKKFTPRII